MLIGARCPRPNGSVTANVLAGDEASRQGLLAIIACAHEALGCRSLESQQLLTRARVKATTCDRWEASISEYAGNSAGGMAGRCPTLKSAAGSRCAGWRHGWSPEEVRLVGAPA